MKILADVFIAVVAIACCGVLLVSIFLGELNDLLFIALLFGLPLVASIGLAATPFLIALAFTTRWREVHVPYQRLMIALALMAMTFLLLRLYVPRRVGFLVSRDAFERIVAHPPPSQSATAPRRLGICRIDEIAADSRGGLYVRTHAGADGIGPDTMSYGVRSQAQSAWLTVWRSLVQGPPHRRRLVLVQRVERLGLIARLSLLR
jgi:hypothetical protein